MNNMLPIILLTILLTSCGGGGSPDNNQPQNNTSLGGIELGPVKGASVAIQALDGYTLIRFC